MCFRMFENFVVKYWELQVEVVLRKQVQQDKLENVHLFQLKNAIDKWLNIDVLLACEASSMLH
jgi:hypothetical protein